MLSVVTLRIAAAAPPVVGSRLVGSSWMPIVEVGPRLGERRRKAVVASEVPARASRSSDLRMMLPFLIGRLAAALSAILGRISVVL